MRLTALQPDGLPGRPGGPYNVPSPPVPIPAFVLPAARLLAWALEASREATFILVAEESAVYVLGV